MNFGQQKPSRLAVSSTRAIVVAWIVLAFGWGGVMAAEAPQDDPAYVVRGKQTEARQHALKERLDRFHERLVGALKRDAPDLLSRLEPPPPIAHGYQLLPRIVPDAPPTPPAKPQVVSYSWGWSDTLISQQMTALDRLEADLAKLQPHGKRASLEAVLDGYKKVIDDRRRIDSDIDYNWIWQAAIARNRAGFDRITKRLDEVVELQKGGKPLTPEIVAAISAVNPQSIAHLEPSTGRKRSIVVPFSTDITEPEFVRKFKTAIEGVWRARVGEEDVRVRLEIETITPRRLYCGRQNEKIEAQKPDRKLVGGPAANCSPPHKGEKINLDAHLARFPKGRVILTTGATSLRVMAGIVVSPHDVTPRVLAHEFGHVLGFPDAYFRGYRDLGADGFQVMELVVDSSDLMGNPGAGLVLPRHMEGLVKAMEIPALMQAGLDALYQRNGPARAAARFQEVLERNPTHYGATFQLAKALDQAGKTDEAVAWWKKALEMAEAIGDAGTAATCRNRLNRGR